jgi:hypothetical protein
LKHPQPIAFKTKRRQQRVRKLFSINNSTILGWINALPQVVKILLTASVLLIWLTFGGNYGEKNTAGFDISKNAEGLNYCYLILQKLAGPRKTFDGRLYLFASAQKNEYLENPTGAVLENPTSVSVGIRFELPIIDQKEELERLKDYLNRLNSARELLSNYLTLRREVEAWEKYLLWRKKRVCAGVEYLKDLWRNNIDIEIKKEELKALEVQLCVLGVPKCWLDRCYFSTIKEKPKYPYPAGVPSCKHPAR